MPVRSRGSTGRRVSRAWASGISPASCRDRLIDIVCDSAGVDPVRDRIDVIGLKRRGFTQILDVEAPHLPNSNGLIAKLRDCIASMDGEAETISVLADHELAHF